MGLYTSAWHPRGELNESVQAQMPGADLPLSVLRVVSLRKGIKTNLERTLFFRFAPAFLSVAYC